MVTSLKQLSIGLTEFIEKTGQHNAFSIHLEPGFADKLVEDLKGVHIYVPDHWRGIYLYGHKAYLLELGFNGYMIKGIDFKMFYYADCDEVLFTKCH